MTRMLKTSLIIMMWTGILSCEKQDDTDKLQTCEKLAIEDQARFNGTRTDHYTIHSARIDQDCLEVEILSSGCDGSTWQIELIDSGTVVDSDRVQRFLRISLVKEEDCQAMVTGTTSFDLSPLRREGKTISFQLEKWDSPLLYKYQEDDL